MSQHTPGPWTIREQTVIENRNDVYIARVQKGSLPVLEWAANARLIAKAPELLALAETLADTDHDAEGCGDFGCGLTTPVCSIMCARALLREVEGCRQ